MSNMNIHGADVNGILDSYFFEPIDVVTICTPRWLKLHSKYHQPQVSPI